jgi:hypothetical protein
VKRLSIKNKDITSDLMFLYECVMLLERERERERERNWREKSCLGERNEVCEESVQIYIYYIRG